MLLEKKKVEIYIRSVFLQGTLLTDLEKLPKKFKIFSKEFNHYHKLLRKFQINKILFNLIFLKKFKFYKYVIVGFNDYNELEEIIKNKNNLKNNKIIIKKKYYDSLITNKKKLILPYNWNKLQW